MQLIDYLIYGAMALVTLTLLAGVFNMLRGGEGSASRSQMLMRYRVIFQAVAIALLALAVFVIRK